MITSRITGILKSILPRPLVDWIRTHNRRQRFNGLSPQDAFDSIYRDGFWGKDADGNPLSGTGSHEEEVVGPYVLTLRDLLSQSDGRSVVDLGCGDFNVGRQLVDCATRYVACDISPTIIELNSERFKELKVEFRQFDLTKSVLPPADFCFVRQVLQHLSNADIGQFVTQLREDSPYRFLIVTEHVALDPRQGFNVDKPTGPGIRVEMGSGIDLTQAPFNMPFLEKKELLSIRQDNRGVPAHIVTTLYRLRN